MKNVRDLALVDYSSLTIEHILPQSRSKVGENDEIIGSVGNLVLVDSVTNSENLRDLDPMEKIEILKEKGFPIAINHLEVSEFNGDAIRKRTYQIADKIYDLLREKIFGNS